MLGRRDETKGTRRVFVRLRASAHTGVNTENQYHGILLTDLAYFIYKTSSRRDVNDSTDTCDRLYYSRHYIAQNNQDKNELLCFLPHSSRHQ